MNLHEYQSKECLERYHMPLPKRFVATHSDQAQSVVDFFSGEKIVAKIQIHAGGRGKAGGVKVIARTVHDVQRILNDFLGQVFVTHQTDEKGQVANTVLFEECASIAKEFYLAITIDRSAKCLQLLASIHGGMDVEQQTEHDPDHIKTFRVYPGVGILPHHAMNIARVFHLDFSCHQKLLPILESLYQTFLNEDASLLEINPLILTDTGHFLALDAKMTIDDNALYRHKHFLERYDYSQDDPKEILARNNDLSYIALNGNIGCLVNGAGLAMATMDLIQYAGGKPANFLDVGGTATEERVTQAFRIILQDPHVKVIFVNIFGGIVRCNIIAQGILEAAQKIQLQCPIVVRLQGNQAQEAESILKESQMPIFVEKDFYSAAAKAVQLTKDML